MNDNITHLKNKFDLVNVTIDLTLENFVILKHIVTSMLDNVCTCRQEEENKNYSENLRIVKNFLDSRQEEIPKPEQKHIISVGFTDDQWAVTSNAITFFTNNLGYKISYSYSADFKAMIHHVS